jgi:hypothetical protein
MTFPIPKLYRDNVSKREPTPPPPPPPEFIVLALLMTVAAGGGGDISEVDTTQDRRLTSDADDVWSFGSEYLEVVVATLSGPGPEEALFDMTLIMLLMLKNPRLCLSSPSSNSLLPG